MMDKGVVKQLGKEDADLHRQRGLLLFGNENNAVDVDDVESTVLHGLCTYNAWDQIRLWRFDGKLAAASQDDFFDEFPKSAIAAFLLYVDVPQWFNVFRCVGGHSCNAYRSK